MMQQEFTDRSYVGADGVLHLDVAIGVPDADVSWKLVVETSGGGKTLTPTEKADAYRAWALQPRADLPILTDEAISRESLYAERG